MMKRTTIEIDPDLLECAREALGETTTRGTVEAALRRVAEEHVASKTHRASAQTRYFEQLGKQGDLDLLASNEMWR
ncbi:MAG TPA: type II toxin-antitoxin system VapB family antitoxin [Thermoanaerobaculia bacterium]|nr:type II toxin-antitoxin system VapB family antitoxin [Thermoanaerobaculia bacterium]